MSYYLTPDHFKLAEKNGISKQLLADRVYQRGWLIDRAISQPKQNKNNSEEFKLWAKVAEANGISSILFSQRLIVSKWSYEKAATRKKMTKYEIADEAKKTNVYTVFTKEQHEVAKANGIKKGTMYARVRNYGWTVDDAITVMVYSQGECMESARANSGWGKSNSMFFERRKDGNFI